MGAYDGAEMCDLVGLYILSKLEEFIPKSQLGLYRDDGLAIVKGSGPQLERLRKKVFAMFNDLGLKVTIETNLKQCDFLDIYLDLQNGIYKPFRKANQQPTYVHKDSNHPTSIKKQIPTMIEDRLSNLSSNKDVFLSEVPAYNNALKNAGYERNLTYKQSGINNSNRKSKRSRRKKVIWFNPPFCQSVKTNIGTKFLSLIDKHFKGSELEKYFNRSTLKISYSCLPNVEKIISGHNQKVLAENNSSSNTDKPSCNCRQSNLCPLQGNCLKASIVYKAEVKIPDDTNSKVYVGSASGTFKERFRNHKLSFEHERYKNNTSLSKYIWELKSENKPYEIFWSIIGKATAYIPSKKTCSLCNLEKTLILFSENKNSLNQRSELMSKCRHRAKHLLSNIT